MMIEGLADAGAPRERVTRPRRPSARNLHERCSERMPCAANHHCERVCSWGCAEPATRPRFGRRGSIRRSWLSVHPIACGRRQRPQHLSGRVFQGPTLGNFAGARHRTLSCAGEGDRELHCRGLSCGRVMPRPTGSPPLVTRDLRRPARARRSHARGRGGPDPPHPREVSAGTRVS
jgi:hypothetical protein